jgi:hypothetical protein
MDGARDVVLLNTGLALVSIRAPEPVQTRVGMSVLAKTNDGGEIIRWGVLPESSPVEEANFATDPLETLIERKCGGNERVKSFLLEVAERASELELRAFCALTPDGEAFLNAVTKRNPYRLEKQLIAPIGYARAILAQSERMLGPRRCLRPLPDRQSIVADGFDGMMPSGDDLVRLFLEDPEIMRTVAPRMCAGCTLTRCPHFPSGPDRRR